MELLLVIALIGLVAVPLSAAIGVGVATTNGTSNRLDSSHDAQLVNIYLPADIQSAGSATGNDPDVVVGGGDTSCSGVANVVRFRWTTTEDLNTAHTYVAAYSVGQSGGEWQLTRSYCVDSTQALRTVVARNLNGANAVSVSPNPPTGQEISVSITEATVPRGDPTPYTYTITGTRRTPSP
jgi:hypothetical protein